MKLNPINDLELIEEIRSIAKKRKTYLVGGCVRDWLLGKKSFDMDFVFDFYPEDIAIKIAKIYKGEFRKFEKFLTIRIFFENRRIDFACFRKEKYPNPADLPIVSKAKDIKEDLKRRDFRINAIALSLNEKDLFEIIDPFNGVEDIKNGEINVLHKNSFRDDPTRIFRAIRFSSRFGWNLGKETFKLLKQAKEKKYINLLSRERIRNEIIKILQEENSYNSFKILKELGLLDQIFYGIEISPDIDKISDWEMKFAFLCGLAEKPLDFLKSLNFERKNYNRIFYTIKPHLDRKTPLYKLDYEQKKVLKLLNQDKDEIAFSDLLIENKDLKKLNIDKFKWSKILDKVSSWQWAGKLKNREKAIAKIKKENI